MHSHVDCRGEEVQTWQDEKRLILINSPSDTPTDAGIPRPLLTWLSARNMFRVQAPQPTPDAVPDQQWVGRY